MLKKTAFFAILCVLFMSAIARRLTAASTQFEPPRGRSQAEQEMLDRQAKEANKKRQQDLKNDTDRLLQLANELKQAVDKSNENVLSLDVVRKADEVEKLAKRVKERMKESIGPPRPDATLPPRTIPPPQR